MSRGSTCLIAPSALSIQDMSNDSTISSASAIRKDGVIFNYRPIIQCIKVSTHNTIPEKTAMFCYPSPNIYMASSVYPSARPFFPISHSVKIVAF